MIRAASVAQVLRFLLPRRQPSPRAVRSELRRRHPRPIRGPAPGQFQRCRRRPQRPCPRDRTPCSSSFLFSDQFHFVIFSIYIANGSRVISVSSEPTIAVLSFSKLVILSGVKPRNKSRKAILYGGSFFGWGRQRSGTADANNSGYARFGAGKSGKGAVRFGLVPVGSGEEIIRTMIGVAMFDGDAN